MCLKYLQMRNMISTDHSGYICTFEGIGTKGEAMHFAGDLKKGLKEVGEADWMNLWCDESEGKGWETEFNKFLAGEKDRITCGFKGDMSNPSEIHIEPDDTISKGLFKVSGSFDGADLPDVDIEFTQRYFAQQCVPGSETPSKVIVEGKELDTKGLIDALSKKRFIASDHSSGMCHFIGVTNKEGAAKFAEDMKKIIQNAREDPENTGITDFYTDVKCDFSDEEFKRFFDRSAEDKEHAINCYVLGSDSVGSNAAEMGVNKYGMEDVRKDRYKLWYQIDDEMVRGEPVYPSWDGVLAGMEICGGANPSLIINGKVISLPEIYNKLTKKKL